MDAREYADEAEDDYDTWHEHVDEHDEEVLEAADARREHAAQSRLAVHGHLNGGVARDKRGQTHQRGYEPSEDERGEDVGAWAHVQVTNVEVADHDQVAVNAKNYYIKIIVIII